MERTAKAMRRGCAGTGARHQLDRQHVGRGGAHYSALKNNMQMFVNAMGVAPDGTVFTSSIWDEAHKEMGFYRDGRDLGQWDEIGSTDWPKSQWSFNNADGGAVAAGDRYVFLTIDRTINSEPARTRLVPPLRPAHEQAQGIRRESQQRTDQGARPGRRRTVRGRPHRQPDRRL